MQKPAVVLESAVQSKDEDPPSSSTQNKTFARNLFPTLLKHLDYPHLCASIRKFAQKVAKNIGLLKMDKSLIEPAGEDLFYTFLSGYSEANDDLENAFFYFLEPDLTETDHRGTLQDMFERRFENCTKFSTYMDAFTSVALTSSRFVRPIVKIILAKNRRWRRYSIKSIVLERDQSSCSFHFNFSICVRFTRRLKRPQTRGR